MLKKLADTPVPLSDPEDEEAKLQPGDDKHPYTLFWEQFGKSIKMGCIEDKSNRPKLAKLLRFATSKSDGKQRSLAQYVKDMAPWQSDVFFVSGESLEAVKKSPFLAAAEARGVEVLFLTDPLDEYLFQHMTEFEGRKMQALGKEGAKFGDEDEGAAKRLAKVYKARFEPLTKYLKELFAGKVGKVSVGANVVGAPAVIVTSAWGYTANMERIMRAQTMGGGDKGMTGSRTLELNPRHPIVSSLLDLCDAAPEEQSTKDLAHLVYDTALLVSGFAQDDQESFADRMYRVIAAGLKVESMDLLPEIDVPEEKAAEKVAEEEDDDEEAEAGRDEF